MIKKIQQNRTFCNIAGVFFFAICTLCIEYIYFGFNHIEWNVPLIYWGDGLGIYTGAKEWLSGNSQAFGWPNYVDLSQYNAIYNMLYRGYLSLFSIVIRNPIVLANVFIFLVPWLNVMVCFLVMRQLGIKSWLAYLNSLAFGFSAYVQYRYMGHFSLGTIECVPITFLLCFWTMEDRQFLKFDKSWYRYRRNWYAIVFVWMIANNGMIYYPVFSCIIFLITGTVCAFSERKIKSAMPAFLLICGVAFFVAIGFIPTIIGMIKGYGNVATHNASRDYNRTIVYGLSTVALLLSPKGYGVNAIANRLGTITRLDNENKAAYLGIIGIIGFMFLFMVGISSIVKTNNENTIVEDKRLRFLSSIVLTLLVICTINGICVIVAFFLPMISCYNRISPFVLFACVLAVAITSQRILSYQIRNKYFKPIIVVLLVCILSYSIWEQQGIYNYFYKGYSGRNHVAMEQDSEFFSKVEERAGENAMIFQLPYMSSFENGPVKKIIDYDYKRGALHSKTLRWSYGAAQNDAWYKKTSQLPTEAMINELMKNHFSGIYINLLGYNEIDGMLLINNVLDAIGCDETLVSANNTDVFIPIDKAKVCFTEEEIFEDDMVEFQTGQGYHIYSTTPFFVGDNENYVIELDVDNSITLTNQSSNVFVDLYGGALYDQPAQEYFIGEPRNEKYTIYLNTGEAPNEEIVCRIVELGEGSFADMPIKKMTITKLKRITMNGEMDSI